MALTDMPKSRRTPLGTILRVLAFVVPLALVCGVLWQQNEKYRGVKIYKSAFDYELNYAERDVLNSQVYVAKAYDTGFQVETNKIEAVKWYKRAAAQGHAEAQYQLGEHYLRGEGVDQDDTQGFRWVQKSAFKDYAPGEYRTGQLLCEGRGTPADCASGLEFMTKSANRGYVPAQMEMALRYENGDGVMADLVQAYVLYALAYDAQTVDVRKPLPSTDLPRVEAKMTPQQNTEAMARYEAKRIKREPRGQDKVLF